MKVSGLEQDSSLKRSELSNEQMLLSIRASMALLVEKVSDMAETLEALSQELTPDYQEVQI